MLKYIEGNLIDAFLAGEVNVIAHQTNCFNTMQSGIAPQIANAFPGVREVDAATTKGDISKLGTTTQALVRCGMVFNLYSQYRYGKGPTQYTDYRAMFSALLCMGDTLQGLEIIKIGMPRIGCGRGGGDWKVVQGIISSALAGFDVTIYDLPT